MNSIIQAGKQAERSKNSLHSLSSKESLPARQARQAKRVYLKNYRPAPYRIPNIHIHFDIQSSEQVFVRSKLFFEHNKASGAIPSLLNLDGENFKTLEVLYNGSQDQRLSIHNYECSRGLSIKQPEQRFQLDVLVELNPKSNTSLEGLYYSSGTLCTQNEAEGFRRISYSLDRPDILSIWHVKIEAFSDEFPTLLAGGNFEEQSLLPAENSSLRKRHVVCYKDPLPKPCYLFALAAGDFIELSKSYQTKSGREIALRFFVDKHSAAGKEHLQHALNALEQAFRFDEQAYGLEYELNEMKVLAVRAFNFGAMENTGLNIFNAALLIAGEDMTTLEELDRISAIIAHEYFHMWTGNRVTVQNWFQLTFKEGLTVFRDQSFSASYLSVAAQRIKNISFLREFQFKEDASPLAHPIQPPSYKEVNNFYTHTVYYKGAEVVGMLACMLGTENFRRALHAFLKHHLGSAVTVHDFFNFMASALTEPLGLDPSSEEQLSHFKSTFFRWYTEKGSPVLEVKQQYHKDKQQIQLHLKQLGVRSQGLAKDEALLKPNPKHKPKPKPFWLPILMRHIKVGKKPSKQPSSFLKPAKPKPLRCICAVDGDHEQTPHLFQIDDSDSEFLFCLGISQATLVFNNASEQDFISLLRNFSAPIIVKKSISASEHLRRISYEDDAFCRYEHLQELIKNAFYTFLSWFNKTSNQKNSLPASPDFSFFDFLDSQLRLESIKKADRELLSTFFSLPSAAAFLNMSLGQSPHLDIKGLRMFLPLFYKTLDQRLGPKLYQAIHFLQQQNDAPSIKLRSVLLQLYAKGQAAAGKTSALGLAQEIFNKAALMSDEYSALCSMLYFDSEEREKAMCIFYRKWRSSPVAILKWIQALSKLPDEKVFTKLEECERLSIYTSSEPNNVHSLWGGFAKNNPLYFHDEQGRAYLLLEQRIQAFDGLNPHISSALLTLFSQVKNLPEPQKGLAMAMLNRLKNKLRSTGSQEILSLLVS